MLHIYKNLLFPIISKIIFLCYASMYKYKDLPNIEKIYETIQEK